MFMSKRNINKAIEDWHIKNNECSLHEYLGMSFEEYQSWVESDTIPDRLLLHLEG